MKCLWQQIPSTLVSEILSRNNDFDGVVLDTEHGVFNDETLYSCIQVITLSGKKCFVRLTEANLTKTRYCLDAGVDGLIFSTVEDWKYVEQIRAQCFLPSQRPIKGRRGYGLARHNFWGESEPLYPIIIAQIETERAVNRFFSVNADYKDSFILDEFNYFLVGPYDLSSSLGCPGDFEDESFKSCMETIRRSVPNCRLGYHIVKDIEKQYFDLQDCGFLAFGLDTLMLIDGIKSIQSIVKGKS